MPKLFVKGQIPWNKGRKMPLEEKLRLSTTLKAKGIKPRVHFVAYGTDHHLWKGDKAGYSAKHYWVSRQLGKPRECSHCGTTEAKKFEWANVSGEYKRDVTDYIRLCCKCHKKYDSVGQRSAETRRQKYA